ncbi:MAG: hypothetical protein A3J63_02230 [Candidatus Moranbacteria bacterium RIFCSPHIGHO2_02_FULL_40_12b]|nr:MAG: hypothetical protein A3J63_02230 [Candidatus Moranbacteria bacterium RIFCSPHIGHO2_02_FULL_40_12b]
MISGKGAESDISLSAKLTSEGGCMKLVVRRITGDDDFSAIEKLQKDIWGIDDITTVPAHILQAVCKYDAGFLAGAFYENSIIGFLFALNTRDRQVQYTHMIGVNPEWQSGRKGINVGTTLNEFHKSEALKQGIMFIEWTFDPLHSNNANLNFHKLGVKVVRYEPDAYGKSSEVGIYRGMPTDRVLVRWPLKSYLPTNVDICDIEKISLVSTPDEINGYSFRMEVPFDIQVLKKESIESACAFRLQSREVFIEALKMGYNVKDFICLKNESRNCYIFSRE